MRVALYARVSKGQFQNPLNQLLELRDWAEKNKAEAKEYVDEISSRDRRPQKEEVLRLARTGLIDAIVVVRLDRWGRTVGEVATELDEFAKSGFSFISLRDGIRLDTPAGRAMAAMVAVFANLERDLIQERTMAGLDRARTQGKILGRHPVGCGCGAKPQGKQIHDGPVVPIREGNAIVAWDWPGRGRVPVKSNPPRRAGGPAPSESVGTEQADV